MFLLLLQLISINGRLRIPHNGTIKTLLIAKWENSDPKRKKRPELADLFRFLYRYFLLFHVTFELIIEISRVPAMITMITLSSLCSIM